MRKTEAPGAAYLVAKQHGVVDHYRPGLGLADVLVVIAGAVLYGLARFLRLKGFPQ